MNIKERKKNEEDTNTHTHSHKHDTYSATKKKKIFESFFFPISNGKTKN